MADRKLKEDLERLRREVDQATDVDSDAGKKFGDIVNSLERHLAEPDNPELHRNLTSSIRDAIENFETDHPRTTAILNDIMVTLSNLGI